MKCAVTLDNGITEIKSQGILDFIGDGFKLDYEIDGDGCTLSYADDKLIQIRRGSVELKLIFSEGEETRCTLGSGALSGSFPLFTESLQVNRGESGVSVLLSYVLAEENKIFNIRAEIIR